MPYTSLQEILSDSTLRFSRHSDEPVHLLRSIERRLTRLQSDESPSAKEESRKLVEARNFLEGKPGSSLVPLGGAVVPVSAIAELVKAIQPAPEPRQHPVEREMADHKTVAATKASADYRKGRNFSAGLGATATLGFGYAKVALDLEKLTSTVALVAYGVFMTVVAAVAILRYKSQMRAQVSLRRLYDPDVQALALRRLVDDIWEEHSADGWPPRFHRASYLRELARRCHVETDRMPLTKLHTVELEDALLDASHLAIDRFVAMGVLRINVDTLGFETFTPVSTLKEGVRDDE